MKILCVDDDAGIRTSLGYLLKDEGYEPVWGSNYEEAIEKFTEHQDELAGALLDLNLGGKNGIELARKLQETSDIPLIAVSAFLDRGTMEECASAGFSACINKPFDGRQLTDAAHELFDTYAREHGLDS